MIDYTELQTEEDVRGHSLLDLLDLYTQIRPDHGLVAFSCHRHAAAHLLTYLARTPVEEIERLIANGAAQTRANPLAVIPWSGTVNRSPEDCARRLVAFLRLGDGTAPAREVEEYMGRDLERARAALGLRLVYDDELYRLVEDV